MEILRVCFADNVKARLLQPDGTYQKAPRKGAAVRAQEHFYKEAVDATGAAAQVALRFQPLKRPDDASS